MRVTFAYPHEYNGKSYKPDQTAEVDDDYGARLIYDGVARAADQEPAESAGKSS